MEFKLLNLMRFDDGGDANDKGGVDGNPSGDDAGGEKKYSDEDVNRIVDAKFAKWQKDQEAKISEAEKLAKMDAQQKAEHERDELQKRLDALESEKTLTELSREARRMLKEHDIDASDELLSVLVTADAEKTKAAVESFGKLFKAAIESAVKDALKGSTPKKPEDGDTLTKEQIMAVKNKAERQRLIAENLDLFR